MVPDLEAATEQKDLAPDLFKLTEVHDIRGEPRNEVNPGQRLMVTILAFEKNSASPLNLRHRPIVKPDSSMDLCVEVR
jgi:hypothetical protein